MNGECGMEWNGMFFRMSEYRMQWNGGDGRM